MNNDKILLNLRIISKIKKNEKIYLNQAGEIIIEKNYFIYTGVKRWIFSHNRRQVIDAVKLNIYKGLDYVNSISNTNMEKNYIINIQIYNNELKNSINGIKSLINTYRSDNTLVSDLELLKDKVERHLQYYNVDKSVCKSKNIKIENEIKEKNSKDSYETDLYCKTPTNSDSPDEMTFFMET